MAYTVCRIESRKPYNIQPAKVTNGIEQEICILCITKRFGCNRRTNFEVNKIKGNITQGPKPYTMDPKRHGPKHDLT